MRKKSVSLTAFTKMSYLWTLNHIQQSTHRQAKRRSLECIGPVEKNCGRSKYTFNWHTNCRIYPTMQSEKYLWLFLNLQIEAPASLKKEQHTIKMLLVKVVKSQPDAAHPKGTAVRNFLRWGRWVEDRTAVLELLSTNTICAIGLIMPVEPEVSEKLWSITFSLWCVSFVLSVSSTVLSSLNWVAVIKLLTFPRSNRK